MWVSFNMHAFQSQCPRRHCRRLDDLDQLFLLAFPTQRKLHQCTNSVKHCSRPLVPLQSLVHASPTISSFLRPKRSLCQRIFSFFSTPSKPLTSASGVVARLKVTMPESEIIGLRPSAMMKKSAVLACIICSVDHVWDDWCGMVEGSLRAGARRVRVG